MITCRNVIFIVHAFIIANFFHRPNISMSLSIIFPSNFDEILF